MTDTETYTPSPSSSPSLAPIDSSPPSSPSPLSICTPPASPGAKDPLAGSSKSSKRPRIYERDDARRRAANIQPYTPDLDKQGEAGDALTRVLETDDATPTRVVDPFSGSAKRAWRPPTYEKKNARVLSTDSAISASSSTSYAYGTKKGVSPTPISRGMVVSLDDPYDDLLLSEDEFHKPKAKLQRETKEEVEHRAWDEAITAAIDKLHGIIDLAGTSLRKGPISHIPPTIADLEGFVVLPPTQVPSSAPSSPKHSPILMPLRTLSSDHTSSSSRPFTRATTLPAAAFNDNFFLRSKDGERLRGTPAARAASMQSVPLPTSSPLRRREIQLFLANNAITRLPAELFRVSSLTVLSLRSNALRAIPPEIAHLTSLQELNVAQNKLRWLPAEMLSMHLTKLVVTGNPWTPPPLPNLAQSQPPATDGEFILRPRSVSETVMYYTIAPLTEVCFRALFVPYPPRPPPLYTHTLSYTPPHPSPSSSAVRHTSFALAQVPSRPSTDTTSVVDVPSRPLTVLETAYALPLTDDLGLGPAVLATFRACVPASVAKPTAAAQLSGPSKVRRDEGQRDVHSQAPEEDVFSSARSRHTSPPPEQAGRGDEDEHAISVCPSPVHLGQTRTPVFVRPAEMRFTWEEVIAGVRVGGDGIAGVGVPVRWRGCGHGCLAFLDPEPQSQPAPAATQSADETDVVFDIPVDADGDVEMSEGGSEVDMQEVRIEGGLADPEDFEEGF